MAIKQVVILVAFLISLPLPGAAQTSQEVNEANNPLTPKLTVNLQDQYISSYYGLDSESNAILMRGVLPHKLFDWPQILRATVPIVASPDLPVGSATGLGDINLFDLLLFKAGTVELGFGPQFTIPSATDDLLGTRKWQAGVAAVTIAPQPWGLLGLTVGVVTFLWPGMTALVLLLCIAGWAVVMGIFQTRKDTDNARMHAGDRRWWLPGPCTPGMDGAPRPQGAAVHLRCHVHVVPISGER